MAGQSEARIVFFPRDDREQALRFRHYLIAAATSLMVVLLLGVSVLAGALAPQPFAVVAVLVLAFITLFYALFRSGLNKRASDPSLTVPMMLSAIGTITYALYHLRTQGTVFLLIYPTIMFFGVFRLNTRGLLKVGAFILCAYGLVVWMAERPERSDLPATELLQGLVLAAVLVWFSFMGGYVHELRKRLSESAYDRLTGIYNRERVLDVLAQEKIRDDRGGGSLCVSLVDVDRFKAVNDSLGHQAGDMVLKRLAEIVREEIRAIDCLGRYGGDELLLVLTMTELEGALECVERIRRRIALSDCIGNDDSRGRVTVSIGVTQHRRGESLQETLGRADTALYRAKSGGRNRAESD